MIYDCILFNGEVDLLLLRLNYLNKHIDKFVIAESEYTFSGLPKPLHFNHIKHNLIEFADKICYITDSKKPDMNSPWENEFYQRNFLKSGLINAKDNDIIILSDLDEIPDISKILTNFSLNSPQRIPMRMSYYYFNCIQNNAIWDKAFITPYKFIKDKNVGNREELIVKSNIPLNHSKNYGWHFSYLFGNDIDEYVNKIKSFSHQEYNNSYFLNTNRIEYCVNNNIDIYERHENTYKIDNDIIDKDLLNYIDKLNLNHLFKTRSNRIKLIFKPNQLYFYYKYKKQNLIYKYSQSYVNRIVTFMMFRLKKLFLNG